MYLTKAQLETNSMRTVRWLGQGLRRRERKKWCWGEGSHFSSGVWTLVGCPHSDRQQYLESVGYLEEEEEEMMMEEEEEVGGEYIGDPKEMWEELGKDMIRIYYINIKNYKIKIVLRCFSEGYRDSSAVRSTCCSHRRSRFPAPMWWFTTICNSRGSDVLLWAPKALCVQDAQTAKYSKI